MEEYYTDNLIVKINVMMRAEKEIIHEICDELIEILERNKVSWNIISKNSYIDMDYIERNIDKKWKWEHVSRNPNLTLDFVKRHLDKKWNWEVMSMHPNIKMEDIEKNIGLPWVWRVVREGGGIQENPNLTMEFVERHKHNNWQMDKIPATIRIENLENKMNEEWI